MLFYFLINSDTYSYKLQNNNYNINLNIFSIILFSIFQNMGLVEYKIYGLFIFLL